MKLYPNPTFGKIELGLAAQESDRIEFIIHNASWQWLYNKSWTYNGSNPELDISHLPPGIYFYDVLIREERYLGKLVLMPGN